MFSPNFITDKEINNLITKIDNEFSIYKEHPYSVLVELIIDGDYSIELRNIVSQCYIKAGWHVVYHRTSKENGERAGLTRFVFLTEETEKTWKSIYDENYRSNFHKVE